MPPSATDALNSLNAFQMPDSNSVLSQAEQKYGVNDLHTQVSNLNSLTGNLTNAIAAVDPSVTGRTAGSLTTEAQRSALVNRERQPVIGQLDTTNRSLSTAKDQLTTADTKAHDEATNIQADSKAKYQKLLDTYNIANAREEAAKQAAAQEAQRQEQIREFNESQATTRGAARYSGSGSGSSAATPASSQRSDGGFNFQDASGNAISARKYAELTGTNFNTVLKKMAASGDKGAADVLKNGGSSKAYKALTWD